MSRTQDKLIRQEPDGVFLRRIRRRLQGTPFVSIERVDGWIDYFPEFTDGAALDSAQQLVERLQSGERLRAYDKEGRIILECRV